MTRSANAKVDTVSRIFRTDDMKIELYNGIDTQIIEDKARKILKPFDGVIGYGTTPPADWFYVEFEDGRCYELTVSHVCCRTPLFRDEFTIPELVEQDPVMGAMVQDIAALLRPFSWS